MNVSEALARRTSVRAFRPDPVPAATVRTLIERAHRAPSGGNLQPWRVHALAGEALTALKTEAGAVLLSGADEADDHAYPPGLWEPFRTRRFENGEDLYAALGIPREDKAARYAQIAQNAELFGAPVGLFFSIDARLGRPQWLDLGIFMQSLMLLAVEHGLDTCAQGFWRRLGKSVAAVLQLPEHHMLVGGMALGVRDEAHAINGWRARRDAFEAYAQMRGFET